MPAPVRYNVFSHLTVEKSALYRAVLQVFRSAKERFAIHLRPRDVEAELPAGDGWGLEAAGIESALQQLVEWHNLERHPDTAEVATVEDFWRARFVYQMSAEGEAAEHAISVFEHSIRQPGELQSAALQDIRQRLEDVMALAGSESPDEQRVYDTFTLLRQRFEELTTQAQRFIGSIQRRVDLQGLEVDAFLAYKQMLIDYIERFLTDLVMATHEIAALVRSARPADIDRLLGIVVRRELADRLMATDEDRAAALATWQSRWRGLGQWFIGEPGRPSQEQELRARARSAIPALIAAVAGINDRRAGRSDRVADLRALAVWFAQAEDDAAAHRLWRAAFGMHSSRHLAVDTQTLDERDKDPVSAQTSWLAAPPLRISPRLHKSGRYAPRGRPPDVIDRAEDKRHLARLAEEEARQIAAARRRLATGTRTRLSELPELAPEEFGLFLDLLGDALARKGPDGQSVDLLSSDGTLRIEMEPVGDGRQAAILTQWGILHGEDHYITITPALAGAEEPMAEPVEGEVPA
jgi:uncharacterized protein (TIGR02677 family)